MVVGVQVVVVQVVEVMEGQVVRGAIREFHFTPFYRLFRNFFAKMPSFTDFWT